MNRAIRHGDCPFFTRSRFRSGVHCPVTSLPSDQTILPKVTTMLRLVVVAVLFVFSAHAGLSRQLPPEMMQAAKDELAAFSWMAGTWSGESWMQVGPGQPQTATVLEQAEFRLGDTLFLIEGRGEHDGQVVHSALATIAYSPVEHRFIMRAHRAGGLYVDADIRISDEKIIWGFEDPRAGQIRYTIQQGPNGEWVEAGEMSRDGGQTWLEFFGMTLTRED